ncbi:MAG: nucleotide exchange factor GrpE [Candidatus Magasanikbacteria bacterium]
MTEEKKYPSLTVGVYIFNKKGEMFLMRAPHWSDKLVIPGGHVDYGESVSNTVIRETKEETGLDVENLDFLKVEEIKDSKDYTKNKHIVSLAYKATLKDDKQEPKLDGREATEFFWIKPKDILKRDDIEEHTYNATEELFVKKKKRGFLKKCKNCEKTDEYKSGWARAQADYQNLVKETEKKRSEWAEYSERQILEEFIPVYDNFKTAFSHQTSDSSPELDNWKKGIEYIMKQFNKVLEDHGVIEIRTVGEIFDPERYEAVSEEESDEESGKIIREMVSGYEMRGKVIRVAKVVVSK